jgi:hypothetical protein
MSLAQRHGRRILALALVGLLYPLTRLPATPEGARHELARRFAFEAHELPVMATGPRRAVRAVHPDLTPHAAWISTVGAAVTLCDLDGDGLPNDAVHVETWTDSVIAAPLPGIAGAQRYPPFVLTAAPPEGIDPATTAPMGSIAGDFNEDGWCDLVVYFWGRPPVLFLRRDPRPGPPLSAADFRAVELVGPAERWYTNAATSADLDGDGHVDLLVGNYFPDGARVLDPRGGGAEAMQDSMSRAFNGGRNRVLRFSAAGAGPEPWARFEEVPDVFPGAVATGWTLGAGAADLDGDLLPEIYFANDFGPDRLLHNRSRPGAVSFVELRGRKTMSTPNSKVLGRDSFKGMGVDFGDLNGDGWLDIYVSNIADEYALEESHFVWVSSGRPQDMQRGVAPYADRSEALGLARSGWGWESRLADFDNDGVLEAVQATGFMKGRVDRWPELHELAMGNDSLLRRAASWPAFLPGDDLSGHQHNPFFVRTGGGRYCDVAAELGLDQPWVTRGIATADADGDGDLDFAIANQWEPSIFHRNDGASGAFLGFDLLLPLEGQDRGLRLEAGHAARGGAGRPAIGAQARVRRPDGTLLVAQVDGGNGHSGARSHQIHFGLGDASAAAASEVELTWRDGRGQPRRAVLTVPAGWHTVWLGEEPAP